MASSSALDCADLVDMATIGAARSLVRQAAELWGCNGDRGALEREREEGMVTNE